jgi:hypothetical protein
LHSLPLEKRQLLQLLLLLLLLVQASAAAVPLVLRDCRMLQQQWPQQWLAGLWALSCLRRCLLQFLLAAVATGWVRRSALLTSPQQQHCHLPPQAAQQQLAGLLALP